MTLTTLESYASLLPFFVAIPLIMGGLLVAIGNRLKAHAILIMITLVTLLAGSVAMVIAFSAEGGTVAHAVGPWPYGIAIPFAADMFTALMLTVTGLLTIMCVWFALASATGNSMFFAPLVLILISGVNGALLTADLFNLFVFIEVMLLPTYGLYVLSANRKTPLRRVDGARLYVTVNLFTSTTYLAGVGFLYGTAGTVNTALLADAAQDDDRVALAGAVCLFALGIKASVVPVHGWLARSYPATSPAMTALFSGLHTKVAIYAIYRIYAVVFGGDARFLWVGVALFSLTMLIGVLGAVGEKTTRSILAFHMVSQIGYILLGVALFTELGLTAGIFYLLHHMIVKASLFLSTGAVEVRYGTGTIGALGGISKTEPVIAVAFFIAALSLAGIPPFSGFVAKFTLIIAGVDAGEWAAVLVMVLVSLVTLLSMLKIWSGMFWERKKTETSATDTAVLPSQSAIAQHRDDETVKEPYTQAMVTIQSQRHAETTTDVYEQPSSKRRIGATLAAPSLILAAVTVCLGLGATLLLDLSATAADGLMDTSGYIEAVKNG